VGQDCTFLQDASFFRFIAMKKIAKTFKKKPGFTLVELAITVLIITLLALFAIPTIAIIRASAQRSRCLDNLRQVNSAVQQYMVASNSTVVPGWGDIEEYFIPHKVPACPAGGAYTIPPNGRDSTECEFGNSLRHHL